MEVLDKYSVGVPPILWLPWTPQLLNCLLQYEDNVILNILCQVGRMFPQAVYFPIRILYFTLRAATARKTNSAQVVLSLNYDLFLKNCVTCSNW